MQFAGRSNDTSIADINFGIGETGVTSDGEFDSDRDSLRAGR
jgi:hypothetical protein